jgi:superfamily I DNA/RNA helicase
VPSKHNTFAVRQSLESINISTTILGPDERDKPDSKSIRIATMHRAKGLDFDEVVLLIPKNEKNFDLSIDTNKRLKYVALTRAKRIASVIQY